MFRCNPAANFGCSVKIRSSNTRSRAAVCAALAMLCVAATAQAAGAPDLTVAKLVAPQSADAGGQLTAVVTTHDAGQRAGASTTGLYLSLDRRLGKGDIRLAGTGHVAALRPGKDVRVTIRAVVPKRVVAGAYYLLACADADKRVRERDEKNDCRASGKPLAVVASPKPLTAKATPDAARAATATIGAAGGTLQATGADGTVYSLSIPAGALPADTALTMTPLASISGAPFAHAQGVQIGPDGLHPLIVPTLTVTPKTSVPAAKRAVFAFDGAGGELHLHPASTVAAGFALPVPRLGGYGFGVATFAAREGFAASHPPTADIDQLAQALGVGKATATGARAAGGPPGIFPSNANEAMLLATANHIQDLLTGATVESLNIAMLNYTAWEAMAAFETPGSPDVTLLRAHIHQAITVAARIDTVIARNDCFSGKDLNALAGLLTMHAYAMALLQIDLGLATVDSAIGACMRFTVSYEGEVTESLGNSVTGDIVVDSTDSPVTLQSGAFGSTYLLEGSLPLTVTHYDFFDYLCDKHGGTATPQTPGWITIKLTPALPYSSYAPGNPNPIVFPPPNITATLSHGSVTTTNACGLTGFSGGLYDHNLPKVFADIYDTANSQFLLPATLFTATRGQAQTLLDASQPAPSTTAYSGRIHLTITHAPNP